jgi:hypothetical protein
MTSHSRSADSENFFDSCNSPGQRDLVGPADNRRELASQQNPRQLLEWLDRIDARVRWALIVGLTLALCWMVAS